MPSRGSNPSSSASSWLSVCSFSSFAAHHARGARAAKAIQLVDEDDARLQLARLLEKVADAGRADADEHLDKFAARDREERHARLARNRAGKKRLADAGRSDKKNAFGHARAKPAMLLRIHEEVDDLFQLALGLVGARNVVECNARFRLDVYFGARAPHTHQAAHSLLLDNAPEEEGPDAEENEDRQNPGQQVA